MDRILMPLKKMSPSQILVTGFASLILLGSFLLSLPLSSATGLPIRYIDAFFTATSAVCVTGLVVLDTGTTFSIFGQIVVLLLIQIGGLGFMTLSTTLAILIGKKIGLRERLLIQESFNYYNLSGLVRLTKQVLLTTFLFEGIGALFLTIRFLEHMPTARAVYFGIFHSISAFCNAGFDLFGSIHGPFASLSAYVGDWLVNFVVLFLFIFGGLGFPVLIDLKRRFEGSRFSLHTKLVLFMTIFLLAIGSLTFFLFEFDNPGTLGNQPVSGKILGALFQGATPRTAGFNTLNLGEMKETTLFMILILMFIGASPSSTGGGIKTTTFGALLLTVWSTIRGKKETEVFERRLSTEIINKALAVTFVSASFVIIITLLLNITEGFPFLAVFFETTSAFGTVGLSTGITPFLSDFGRVFIMITMFSGRVGLLTIALALTQRLQQKNGLVKYPEEKVIIG